MYTYVHVNMNANSIHCINAKSCFVYYFEVLPRSFASLFFYYYYSTLPKIKNHFYLHVHLYLAYYYYYYSSITLNECKCLFKCLCCQFNFAIERVHVYVLYVCTYFSKHLHTIQTHSKSN